MLIEDLVLYFVQKRKKMCTIHSFSPNYGNSEATFFECRYLTKLALLFFDTLMKTLKFINFDFISLRNVCSLTFWLIRRYEKNSIETIIIRMEQQCDRLPEKPFKYKQTNSPYSITMDSLCDFQWMWASGQNMKFKINIGKEARHHGVLSCLDWSKDEVYTIG